MLQIKNTKTRVLEEFKPLSSREVKVYFCGPTVYNYAHIGNLRTFVFEDIVIRTLKFLGYNVASTMNITDVDDKTIRDSVAEGIPLKEFTEKYTEKFISDLEKLSIIKADIIQPITQIIPEMTRMINTMLRRKNAYISEDGSVYFEVASSKTYGRFANLDMKNLKSGARVDSDEYEKDSVSDFVLWKSWKESDKDNFWEEEFTIPKTSKYNPAILKHENIEKVSENEKEITIKVKGRPGWHIECSACAMKHFGQQIDIHMGGVDLIFPHHQNEIAQTEVCTRKEFSKYWLHSGHLTVDGKKMAKSANNFYTIKDLESKYTDIPTERLYRGLRLSFMNAKYASQVDFSFAKLESNFSVIEGIDELLKNIKRELTIAESKGVSRDFSDTLQDHLAAFMENLEDDFNIPEVLAVFHNFMKLVNTGLREKLFCKEELEAIIDFLKTFDQILSIIDFSILEGDNGEISADVLELFEQRNTAKSEKNFEAADRFRDELLEKGFKIVDNRDGSFLERV